MGDVSSEPTMEEILSSIKRVIEESEGGGPAGRPLRRPAATTARAAQIMADADADRVPDAAPSAETPDAGILELSQRAEPSPSEARAESILSADAAQATRGPLETLSRMVVKPDSPGADTLEGLVREMLRPMLREWLDARLPGIVESMVAKEIARISGRGF